MFFCKDNASREQNKMNTFIFYAEAQLISALRQKYSISISKQYQKVIIPVLFNKTV